MCKTDYYLKSQPFFFFFLTFHGNIKRCVNVNPHVNTERTERHENPNLKSAFININILTGINVSHIVPPGFVFLIFFSCGSGKKRSRMITASSPQSQDGWTSYFQSLRDFTIAGIDAKSKKRRNIPRDLRFFKMAADSAQVQVETWHDSRYEYSLEGLVYQQTSTRRTIPCDFDFPDPSRLLQKKENFTAKFRNKTPNWAFLAATSIKKTPKTSAQSCANRYRDAVFGVRRFSSALERPVSCGRKCISPSRRQN